MNHGNPADFCWHRFWCLIWTLMIFLGISHGSSEIFIAWLDPFLPRTTEDLWWRCCVALGSECGWWIVFFKLVKYRWIGGSFLGDCRFVATNRRNISLDMEFLTPPSGVCILIYSRSYRTNRHQPFCGSLGTQSSECGARTGHSRKNQKSGCLASPCRHARKATVFANFGDSWLASSSCTQA